MKVILILADGMRPDGLEKIPQVQKMMQTSSYTLNASTVWPSVTLPCHMSLFHSVNPQRHGTTTNIYMPQVRPVKGLCEVLADNKKKSAFFYSWEELRDIARPGSLAYSEFCSGRKNTYFKAGRRLADSAVNYLKENDIDFTFLYLGEPDFAGHSYGWMSDEYVKAVENAWAEVERVENALSDDYTILVTADHGGHDRIHGEKIPEDMTIPLFIKGKDFNVGQIIKDADIKDIAPTVVRLLGVEADDEWEGNCLI